MRLPTIEHHKVKDLIPWGENPRAHDVDQLGRLDASIRHHGLASIPVIQAGTRRILAGHARVQVLLDQGEGETVIPCAALDCSEEDAAAYTVADNRLVDLSEWNVMDLRSIFGDLDNGEFDVASATGYTEAEIKRLFGSIPEGMGAEVEAFDAPEADPEVYELEIVGNKAKVVGPNKKHGKAILQALCGALGYEVAK